MKRFLLIMLSLVIVSTTLNIPVMTAYAADWTVTFHDVDGQGGTSVYECNNNATIPRDQDPVRDGWYFAGWYKDAELTQLWYDSDKVTSGIDLYAKWVNLPGTVVTDNIDRENNITYSGGGNYASRVINWFAPGYPYSYIGEDKVLINQEVSIVIDLNNAYNLYGAVINTTDSKCGSYRFSGSQNGSEWTTIAEVTNSMDKVSDCTFAPGSRYRYIKLETLGDHQSSWWAYHKVAILGESNPYTYSVNFMSEGKLFHSVENITENTVISETIPVPTHSQGLAFVGWYYDEEYKRPWLETDAVSDDTTIYAKWADEIYTVTFDIGDDNPKQVNIAKNTTVTQPADPERENFLFCGWYSDDEYTDLFDFETPISANIVIYAKWASCANSINRTNGISAITPMTEYDNRSGRTALWFTQLDSTADKQVVAKTDNPIVVKLSFDQPYRLTAIQAKNMDSMKNVDYVISASNDDSLAWNDDGWTVIADVKANGAAIRNLAIDDTRAYKYVKLHILSDAWVGFYGVEFFGEPVSGDATSAQITGVEGTTVYYNAVLSAQDLGAKVIVALYDSEESLVAVKTVDAALASCSFDSAEGADKAKIFIWKDFTTLRPIVMDTFEF